MSDSDVTILHAAIAILREQGIERVKAAHDFDERDCANAALLASVNIESYLKLVDSLERPF